MPLLPFFTKSLPRPTSKPVTNIASSPPDPSAAAPVDTPNMSVNPTDQDHDQDQDEESPSFKIATSASSLFYLSSTEDEGNEEADTTPEPFLAALSALPQWTLDRKPSARKISLSPNTTRPSFPIDAGFTSPSSTSSRVSVCESDACSSDGDGQDNEVLSISHLELSPSDCDIMRKSDGGAYCEHEMEEECEEWCPQSCGCEEAHELIMPLAETGSDRRFVGLKGLSEAETESRVEKARIFQEDTELKSKSTAKNEKSSKWEQGYLSGMVLGEEDSACEVDSDSGNSGEESDGGAVPTERTYDEVIVAATATAVAIGALWLLERSAV